MTTERIDVVVGERGAAAVKRKIEEIGNAAEKSDRQIEFLKRGLGLLAGAFGIRALIQQVDAYTTLTNRIKLYTNSAEEAAAVQAELFKISQETRSSLTSNADLYARLAQSTRDLGTTQRDVLNLTKALNQAAIISGASTQEQYNALVQLGQGLASGALRGDEFRSVAEQLPKVLDVIAQQSGKTRKQLREMAEEGQITAKLVLDSFKKAMPQLQAEFDELRPTMSQAFVVIQNALTNFIGGMDQASGVSATLAEGLIYLANNFEYVAAAIILVAGAAGIAGLVSVIGSLGTAATTVGRLFVSSFVAMGAAVRSLITLFGLLTTAVLTNPLFLGLAAVVGTLVTLFFVFREEINELIESFGGLRKIVNVAVGAVVGGVNTIIRAWSLLPGAIADLAIQAANGLIRGFQNGINTVVFMLNKLPGIAIENVNLGQLENRFAGTAAAVGRIASEEFNKGIGTDFVAKAKSGLDQVKKLVDGIVNPGTNTGSLDGLIRGGSNRANAASLSKEQQSAFDSLLKKIDPIAGAQKEVAEATKLLTLAQQAGIITMERKTELMAALNFAYRDALDPLGKINREIEEETNLLKLNTEEREVQRKVLDAVRELREKGLVLGPAEIKELELKFQALQKLNDQRQREIRLLEEIQDPLKNYTRDMEALRAIQDQITPEQFENTMRRIRITFLDTQTDMASGFERAFLKFEDSLANAAQTAEDLLTGAFDRASEALTNFLTTSEINIDSLKKAIQELAAQLIKLGSQQLFGGIGQLLGFGSGTSGGGFNIGSALGGLFGFAHGGEFTVGANTSVGRMDGLDNRLVMFKARDNEKVRVTKPGQGGGDRSPMQIVLNGVTDFNSFKRSEGQLQAAFAALLARADRRNN